MEKGKKKAKVRFRKGSSSKLSLMTHNKCLKRACRPFVSYSSDMYIYNIYIYPISATYVRMQKMPVPKRKSEMSSFVCERSTRCKIFFCSLILLFYVVILTIFTHTLFYFFHSTGVHVSHPSSLSHTSNALFIRNTRTNICLFAETFI